MSMRKPTVAVLLSTYNGMKYIEEQLNSLFSQVGDFDLTIYIRDDGSSDGTGQFIQEFMNEHRNIILNLGKNLGVIGSFFELLSSVEKYDYYAFCDQDDIWHPLKIEAALLFLDKAEHKVPAAYCTSYDYVDENLNVLGRSPISGDISINNLLIENCAPGCTVLFNHSLLQICRRAQLNNIHDKVVMHDWFVVLTAILFGNLYFDNNSYIYYRQHANNVVGVNHNVVKSFFNKTKKLLTHKGNSLLVLQAETLLEYYKESISNDDLEVFNNFLQCKSGLIDRLTAIKESKLRRNKLLDDIAFKFLYICGYYK